MRIKHIAFSGIDPASWEQSQRAWLAASIGAGGLASTYAAETKGEARAVFAWDDAQVLQRFMDVVHDATLASAGSVGRTSVLYLDPVDALSTTAIAPAGAGFVGESIAWLKDGGDDAWVAGQRVWNEALPTCDGFLGCAVARGRRTYLVTTFWRDEAAHEAYLRDVVPRLRSITTGDEVTARLQRFHGRTVASLGYARGAEA
jgi:hypothetical protein